MTLDAQADVEGRQLGTKPASGCPRSPVASQLPGRLLRRATCQLGGDAPPALPAPLVSSRAAAIGQNLLWLQQGAGRLTETISNPDKCDIYPILYRKKLEALGGDRI